MGFFFSKAESLQIDEELEEIKACLTLLLKQLSPSELLIFATEDTEIYELCKADEQLRQNCIVAAVRRYHTEKFFFEEVHNRTADYVVMLDHFVEIQDEYERRELEKAQKKYFFLCGSKNHDSEGPQNQGNSPQK